jgi:hypothetical protein
MLWPNFTTSKLIGAINPMQHFGLFFGLKKLSAPADKKSGYLIP